MPKSPRAQRLSTVRAQAPRRRTRTSISQSPTHVPHQGAGMSNLQRSVIRVETRSMTRANAAHTQALQTPPRNTQALLTPPRTIQTYKTRNRTILPTIPSHQTNAAGYGAPGGSVEGPDLTTPVSALLAPPRTTRTFHVRRLPEATHSPTADELSKVDDDDVLRKVAEGLKLSSRCDICYCLMQRPFTLECGHSACGPCLHRHFSSILAPRVQAINCNVPTTTEEVEQVMQAAWDAGVLPRTMFSYICPTCRQPIKAPPTDHISLKSLIGSIRTALKDRSDLLKDEMGCVDESGITRPDYFAGLFLKK